MKLDDKIYRVKEVISKEPEIFQDKSHQYWLVRCKADERDNREEVSLVFLDYESARQVRVGYEYYKPIVERGRRLN